jgi:hypothetical protein
MVRGVGDGNIILMDELGNKMNADGSKTLQQSTSYPWDTVENIKMNNAFLVKAEKNLDANKNFASVKFSMIHTPMDTKAMIEKARGFELVTEGILCTIKNDVKLDRVTHYLQEQFSGKGFRGIYSK